MGCLVAFSYPLSDSQRRIVALSSDLADLLAPGVSAHDRDCTFSTDNLETLHQAGYLRLALIHDDATVAEALERMIHVL